MERLPEDLVETWTIDSPYIICRASNERLYIRCEFCLTDRDLDNKLNPKPYHNFGDSGDEPISPCYQLLMTFIRRCGEKRGCRFCSHIVYQALENWHKLRKDNRFITPYMPDGVVPVALVRAHLGIIISNNLDSYYNYAALESQ